MELLKYVILGFLQGFTEPLPISSSGHIFLFSAFEDDGNIVGAYFKTVSLDSNNPRGADSLFFFKMSFDGEILNL